MAIVYTDYDKNTGVQTKVHEHDGKTTFEKTYDAKPLLKEAEMHRQATEGMNWGVGKKVGVIPMAELGKMMRQDGTVDQARLMQWLKDNPALVCFDKFLK